MKNITLSLLLCCCSLMVFPNIYSQTIPCNLLDARGCSCPKEASSCDLLPDMNISQGVYNRAGGWVEYSQTDSNPKNAGLLRITVTTPNIGWGPIVTVPTDKVRCGNEPYLGTLTGKCPDGNYPQRLINQRIYHKEGANMTFYDRPAGYMTFHPTHSHMHTNDWEHMSLRVKLKGEDDPTKWPIVGTTSKTGFCLQDYTTCDKALGLCTTNTGEVVTNSKLPNFGLGGGEYNIKCEDGAEQGISVGYMDTYTYDLDDMDIRIPPESCNGQYQVVIELDPLKKYSETDRSNNLYTFPVFLTNQRSGYHPHAKLSYSRPPRQLCEGDVMTLFGSPGFEYLWSNGETTPSITITKSGTYSAKIIAPCGTDNTKAVTLNFANQPNIPTSNVVSDVCAGTSVQLNASGNGKIYWYDTATGGNPIAQGNTLQTPLLNQTKTYYASIPSFPQTATYKAGLTDKTQFTGDYVSANTGYMLFDALQPFRLKTVKVYAQQAGSRTIELRNSNGIVLRDTTLNVPTGESRIPLNFKVEMGNNYQLGLGDHSVGGLYRHQDVKLVYPMLVEDVVSLSASSAGLQYYYFFYDWELEEIAAICANKRIAVNVPVKTCTPDLDAITFSPNPSDGHIAIRLPFNAENLAFKVYDLTGRMVKEQSFSQVQTDQNTTLDLSMLPNGVYIVQTVQNNQASKGQRLVIVR